MQSMLATSVILISLGASADDKPNDSVLNRLLGVDLDFYVNSEEEDVTATMRRSESWGGCYDSTGRLQSEGTHIPGGNCQHYVCQDGRWESVDVCHGANRLGASGPVAVPSRGSSSSVPSVDCPLPTFKGGKWVCPDQKLTLAQRRVLFDRMKPFDEINGVKLSDYWPATAGKTVPIASKYEYDYEDIAFKAYRLSRPTGERAPVHYHEVAQQLCLEKGKIMVMTDGEPDKFYSAPDCYMMPAYTKVSVISIEEKVERCLLRVPKGGMDWIVIEPDYYQLQGQWTHDVHDTEYFAGDNKKSSHDGHM